MDKTTLACWTNGADTVVAHDANDARRVMADLLGERIKDIAPMTRVDDAKVLAVWSESAPDPIGCACRGWVRADCRKETPNGHHPNCGEGRPSKTAAEWAQSNGRGFLCSTEW